MSHDTDNPAKQAAEEAYANSDQITSGIVFASQERHKNATEILELMDQIGDDKVRAGELIENVAQVIRDTVSKRAPKLAEFDLIPAVTVVDNDGKESTMRLLEVPGSGRTIGNPFNVLSRRFTAIVTHITAEGRLVDAITTRGRKGRRVVFTGGSIHETLPKNVVKFQNGIYDVLEDAAYKGVADSRNHRPISPSSP